MKHVFLIVVFYSFYVSSFAQKDSITELKEVILLEDFTPRKTKGITSSSVLQGPDLEQFGPIAIAASLNKIPGVHFLSGALNTNRITIRGVGARTPFGTDKLRLYFDGIPVTNGTGFSTIEAFDLENLGLVEVIKGPKGTSFGTNLGGAILLNSKTSNTSETLLSNSFTIGSYNSIKDNISFKHSENEKLNVAFSYNHFETDGYRQNNSFKRDGILLNTSLATSTKNRIRFLLNYIDYTAQIPSTLNQTDFEENPTNAAANWLATQGFEANKYLLTGFSNNFRFSDNLENTTSIFYTYLDHFEPRPFNILDEFTNGYGFRSVFNGKFAQGNEYSFGSEFYRDEYHWSTYQNLFRDNNGQGSLQGDRLSRNREFRRQFNVFGTFTLNILPELYAQLGLNLNQTSYDFRDLFNLNETNTSARRDFDPILLPSLGLKYFVKHGHLYGNFSRGFSNPSLEETLTPDGVINPDIVQEKGVNYELGGQLTFFKPTISLNFSVYQMNINDLLVAQRVEEDQFIGRNAGETKHQGFEFAFGYSTKLSEKLSINPFLSYTYSNHSFVDFIDGINDFSGNPLTGVPKHRVSSNIGFKYGDNITFTVNHQYVDEIPLTDVNTLNSDSFNVFGLQLRYKNSFSKKFNLGINFGLNNIFDTNYAQSVLINASSFGGAAPRYFYPGDGRNYYSSIRLNYIL
ncbi:TonB-dependent receptor family protein [uncultured Croceitalea sp.]|uniref:TonB-dependent receptor family protein n=1 Tax=uncultured Croceitalea sp. TaxID=1798908 RepID=UPI00374F28D6